MTLKQPRPVFVNILIPTFTLSLKNRDFSFSQRIRNISKNKDFFKIAKFIVYTFAFTNITFMHFKNENGNASCSFTQVLCPICY